MSERTFLDCFRDCVKHQPDESWNAQDLTSCALLARLGVSECNEGWVAIRFGALSSSMFMCLKTITFERVP